MRNVVLGFLGTQLDAAKRRRWRPTVSLVQHDGFPVDRVELLYDARFLRLAEKVRNDLTYVSPETEVLLVRMDLDDPWDFQEVYGKLFDFAADYGFDEERERYHVHLTTGTHVAQICWFLLTESRHIPARLAQTGPPRAADSEGTLDIIDLDLSRYNALQQRFDAAAEDSETILKGGVETRDAAFNALIGRIEQVAVASDAPILLLGETGAGKTRLAERIYELKLQRRRVKGRLVEVNCATLNGEAGMADLFGRTRSGGAGRRGLLREADGGVLFLDEVDALDLDAQAILLNALETGRFRPVGSDHEATSRFQVIAGAGADLAARVRAGAFRADLHARLDLWTFTLPPLRERRADIAPNIAFELARMERLLGAKIGFNADAMAAYGAFAEGPEASWPGNFRDLASSVQRMSTLAPRGRITLAMVQEETQALADRWATRVVDADADLVREALGSDAAPLDLFDVPQLAQVIRTCRESKTRSEAGRKLFSISRLQKTSGNDSDRLRKYLARFGATFASVQK